MTLLDDFERIDLETIRAFITARQEEHLSLEFKRCNSADLSNADDRRNFAKALSGFANAAGGIIVWGVATSKHKGVDVASTEAPISDLTTFLGRLNEFTSVLVNPRTEGVRHKKIELRSEFGFAVSLVPESMTGPHMAKGGIDQYIRRHGDRFLVMEHYEVADMFGRRARARLELDWSFTGGALEHTARAALLRIRLRNGGRAAAIAPVLTISIAGAHRIERCGLTLTLSTGESLLQMVPASDGSIAFVGGRGLVLPPGFAFDVANIALLFPRGQGAAPRSIHCGLAAENSIFEERSIEFSREELLSFLPTG